MSCRALARTTDVGEGTADRALRLSMSPEEHWPGLGIIGSASQGPQQLCKTIFKPRARNTISGRTCQVRRAISRLRRILISLRSCADDRNGSRGSPKRQNGTGPGVLIVSTMVLWKADSPKRYRNQEIRGPAKRGAQCRGCASTNGIRAAVRNRQHWRRGTVRTARRLA